jgi:hypothetical protein
MQAARRHGMGRCRAGSARSGVRFGKEKQFSLQKLDGVITSLLLRLPPAQHVSRCVLYIFVKFAFFWNVQWRILARLMDIP